MEWIGKMGEALAEDVAKYDALTCSYVSVTVSYWMRERERKWFIEKGHGAMSIVVMNIVKQLQINVKLQVQHLSRPNGTAYSKTKIL